MVVAFVTPANEGQNPIPELKVFARQTMSQHMQPREYRLVDSFPLTPNGKTDFQKLRSELTGKRA
jgi:acyl-CoA synthetase (AMP-forming)/AMP-acid ligase II